MDKKDKTSVNILSIIFLVLDTLILIATPLIQGKMYGLYQEFGIKLPSFMHIIFFHKYIFIIIALILIAKEFAKNKMNCIINIVTFIILGFLLMGPILIGFLSPLSNF
ncbi:MAG: hypothetical protein P9L93_05890 [Candidatus Gorgyraea atricola]|nr:hypothetical protein [Candidatus Gorgyraea atricola]